MRIHILHTPRCRAWASRLVCCHYLLAFILFSRVALLKQGGCVCPQRENKIRGRKHEGMGGVERKVQETVPSHYVFHIEKNTHICIYTKRQRQRHRLPLLFLLPITPTTTRDTWNITHRAEVVFGIRGNFGHWALGQHSRGPVKDLGVKRSLRGRQECEGEPLRSTADTAISSSTVERRTEASETEPSEELYAPTFTRTTRVVEIKATPNTF